TFDWVHTAAATYCRAEQIRVYVCMDQEKIAAIAPLHIVEQPRFWGKTRRLEFLADSANDCNKFIVRDGCEWAIPMLLSHIWDSREKWSCVVLNKVDAESALAGFLAKGDWAKRTTSKFLT